MSDSTSEMTPEVVEILREVARDPDSILFRHSVEQTERGLMEGEATSSRQAGLSSAERELLGVHREVAADHLLACVRTAFHSTTYGRKWYTSGQPTNSVKPVLRWEDLQSGFGFAGLKGGDKEGRWIECAQLQRSPNQAEALSAFLGLSGQLVPSGKHTFFTAVTRAASGDTLGCLDLLRSGLQSGRLLQFEVLSLLSAGIACAHGGGHSSAYSIYTKALALAPKSTQCLISVAGQAFVTGQDQAGREALQQLRDVGSDPIIRIQIKRQQASLWDAISSNPRQAGRGDLCYERISDAIDDAL